jgi:putative Mg2+ transporter-C (MgtC) family protein
MVMSLVEQTIVAIELLLAAILSMVIGLERERHHKAAGVRTHMLVGVGACLFTALSHLAFGDTDTSRVASNVVTGIGFLGAGVIFREKGQVHDLTTAASIWATAAVGMATGVGAWFLALAATVLIWLILAILRVLPIRSDHGAYVATGGDHQS